MGAAAGRWHARLHAVSTEYASGSDLSCLNPVCPTPSRSYANNNLTIDNQFCNSYEIALCMACKPCPRRGNTSLPGCPPCPPTPSPPPSPVPPPPAPPGGQPCVRFGMAIAAHNHVDAEIIQGELNHTVRIGCSLIVTVDITLIDPRSTVSFGFGCINLTSVYF